MGQQLLLLLMILFLRLIGGGDRVAEGIKMFPEKSAITNRNAVCNDLVNLAARAQQYYRLPTALGGGGGRFDGLTLEKLTNLPGGKNANGTYTVGAIASGPDGHVVIHGVGIETGADGTPLKMDIFVRSQGKSDTLIVAN